MPRDPASQPGPEWFREMVESITRFAIFSTDTSGRVVTWNPGAEQLLGYRASEILRQPTSVLFTDEDMSRGAPEGELSEAKRTGSASDDRWHVRQDGSRFWASGLMMPMRGATGGLAGFVKVIRDRTNEKLASDSLRVSEERFARAFLGSPAALSLQTVDTGRLTLVNEAFLRITGFWRAEALGKSWDDLNLWAVRDQRDRAVGELEASGSAGPLRVDIRTKQQATVPVVAAFQAMELAGERTVQAVLLPAGNLEC